MSDQDDEATLKWLQGGASKKGAPAGGEGEGEGAMSSIGAGLKGAAKEATGWTGLAPEWSKSDDPEHPTAEWAGREAASLAPMVGLDIAAPEIGFLPTASRLGRLANSALNAGWKGAAGGAASQPDRTEGAKTGAEIGAGGGLARGAFNMLPSWAKHAAVTGAVATPYLAHESGLSRYMPHGLAHRLAATLGGLAAAASKAPATAGAVGSQVENWMSGDKSQ
jgi:hypothetical protein